MYVVVVVEVVSVRVECLDCELGVGVGRGVAGQWVLIVSAPSDGVVT